MSSGLEILSSGETLKTLGFWRCNLEYVFLFAAIIFGITALVQSFRASDANQMLQSYKRAAEQSEFRMRENIDELRRVEKEHARMVQMVTDFAYRLNE